MKINTMFCYSEEQKVTEERMNLTYEGTSEFVGDERCHKSLPINCLPKVLKAAHFISSGILITSFNLFFTCDDNLFNSAVWVLLFLLHVEGWNDKPSATTKAAIEGSQTLNSLSTRTKVQQKVLMLQIFNVLNLLSHDACCDSNICWEEKHLSQFKYLQCYQVKWE